MENTALHTKIQEKLNPARFSGMSPKMAALVGCIIGLECTEPVIERIYVTSDGFLLAQRKGDIGANDFLGSYEDFESNWKKLLDCVADELSHDEWEYARALLKSSGKVTFS